MDLLTFRIPGAPGVQDSTWHKVGRGFNLLQSCHGDQARLLLQMLQTINPPYDFQEVNSFGVYPPGTSSQQDPKQNIISKKTVALAIFTASTGLVQELAKIDPVFYETDRIELGRRRDQSLWINFVELSGATRWSEIEATVSSLVSPVRPGAETAGARLLATIGQLRGTDRIKGEVAAQLNEQLLALRTSLPENDQQRLDQCLHAVDRALHFRQAKDVVVSRLPLFFFIPARAMEEPAAGTDGDAAAAISSALFKFLAARLWQRYGDQKTFASCMDRVNHRLQTLLPEQILSFKVEEKALFLESTEGSAHISFTALPPVEKLLALMAALAALHEALLECHPIFLLDCNGLKLQRHEQAELLKGLIQYAAHFQCLVAADSVFLTLCDDFFGKAGNDVYALEPTRITQGEGL